ncbi:hypothetical protein GCM10010401_01860 [Rarobacter faecitabidus]|uniref:DUF4439 domain-containing protein n=2 Tax=Rarobacter faecitabidus TaxID=13243 RepID=A0A542ZWK0_RARFA|nr:hypothetical protein FB461_1188 [Rarobacter faecitabidus]
MFRCATALAAILALTLGAGCGVRIETPAPTAPAPDAAEVLREAMVADALMIQVSAAQLGAAGTASQEVATVLTRIASDTATQITALGGTYDPGPDYVSRSVPITTPSPTPVTVESLIQLLADSANRTRGTLPTVEDPLRARLYASIALSDYESAVTLVTAASVGVETELKVTLPATDYSSAVAATASATLPPGLSQDEAIAAIASLDAVGYAREQWGLHTSSKSGTKILDQSRSDRSRARAWAISAGIAGTDADPREVFYVVGEGRPAPRILKRFARDQFADQTHRFLAAFASVGADERQSLLDFATEAYLAERALGAEPSALPGLSEYDAEGADESSDEADTSATGSAD